MWFENALQQGLKGGSAQYTTLTSYECHGVSNHQQLDSLFNFFRITKVIKAQQWWKLSHVMTSHGLRGVFTETPETTKASINQYRYHYDDVIMGAMASQITSLTYSLFGRRSKKASKFRVTGLCAGNSPGTGEFPAQMASNAENVSIWWRHHDKFSISSNKIWIQTTYEKTKDGTRS